MLDQYDAPVCPYTGLRTFTEDEAIYFRGRETHIGRCIELLKEQHFVMITGASGDGKSSLVYAGVLPEIRAGFFRAKYGNWAVCTFKPERQPLRQMARAVAAGLELSTSTEAVESELSQGFSSLVELYQNSALVPTTPGPGQPEATEADAKRQRAESANLLIIVDQFEEFFTNAENYTGTQPGAEAQTVVNLLLETTRLAREQQLPIYIVCTMRSDYIGQCADFRGLVELIGESQYFVPRLLRNEFVQIIREPALLSGNRIAERLVQRLVDDNRDGRDQLPVLQHALYRIWQAASQGQEELDLVHYAMIGGLAVEEVPRAHQVRITEWRRTLSAEQQERLFARPSLRNVLDAHANQLYAEAADLYNQDFSPPVSAATAARIIEHTFRSLTKVDAQRVVRNRLTGAEITAIINDPELPWPVVSRVLRPFRQPGNTFLSPFITDAEADNEVLSPDAVLDITHESLIRNWQRLAEWAQLEAADVSTVQQLTSQARSWEANTENRGFLLPIGPYMQFAKWYSAKRPNASWLAYYASDSTEATSRVPDAEAQTRLLSRYLDRSKRGLWFSLFVTKYGAGRLAAAITILLAVGVGLFFFQKWRKQQTDYVLYSLLSEQIPASLTSALVELPTRADLVINADRVKEDVYTPWLASSGSIRYAFAQVLDDLQNDTLALDLELKMFEKTANYEVDSRVADNPMASRLLPDIARRLKKAGFRAHPAQAPITITERRLAARAGRYVMACTYYLNYHPGAKPEIQKSKQEYLEILRQYLMREIQQRPAKKLDVAAFSYVIRVVLSQGNYSSEELAFLGKLSPFDTESAKAFNYFFPANSLVTGRHSGYVTYAYIATALDRPSELSDCLDSIPRVVKGAYMYSEGGNSVLPYLIKYRRLTPGNIYYLLKKCSKASKTAFALTYASFCYHLISAHPSAVILDYNRIDYQRVYSADLLDRDLISFDLPLAARDQVWEALMPQVATIAWGEPDLWSTQGDPNDVAKSTAYYQAFTHKLLGVYQATMRKDEAGEAAEAFDNFDEAYNTLTILTANTGKIALQDWTLAYTGNGIWMGDSDRLSASSFLLTAAQPSTADYSSFRTCSYRSFWAHLIAKQQPVPSSPAIVHLLDSTAYREVITPSAAGAYQYYDENMGDGTSRSYRVLPDTVLLNEWHKLTNAPWSDSYRSGRNTFLLTLVKGAQNPKMLRRIKVKQDILPNVRRFINTAMPFRIPLRIAMIDFAKALVAQGRVDEAVQLVRAMPAKRAEIASTILAEHIMLSTPAGSSELKSRGATSFMDSFLTKYGQVALKKPSVVSENMVPLFFWNAGYNKASTQRHLAVGNVLVKEAEGRFGSLLSSLILGRVLSGQVYETSQAIPAYVSQDISQDYSNSILAFSAYKKLLQDNQAITSGWREYDSGRMGQQNAEYSKDKYNKVEY